MMTKRSSVKCVLTKTDPKTTAAVKQGHTLSLPCYYPNKSYKCGTQALGCIQERRGEAVCRLLALHSHHMRYNTQTVGQAFSTAHRHEHAEALQQHSLQEQKQSPRLNQNTVPGGQKHIKALRNCFH